MDSWLGVLCGWAAGEMLCWVAEEVGIRVDNPLCGWVGRWMVGQQCQWADRWKSRRMGCRWGMDGWTFLWVGGCAHKGMTVCLSACLSAPVCSQAAAPVHSE